MTLRLCADIVLLDIDRTIVEVDAGVDFMSDVLFDLVAAKSGMSIADAKQYVHTIFDPQEKDPASYMAQLGIDPQTYRQQVFERIREHTIVYPDAVELIRRLMRMGFRLYPATTNGPTAIAIKLAVAGLADRDGATCFTELFGGSTVCPEGKSGPAFFLAILKRLGAAADDVIMIGDDPKHDFADALAAGIRQIVIVDREQKADKLTPDPPAMRVRSLTEIIPLLARRTS